MIMTKYFYLVALLTALNLTATAQNNNKTINITNFTAYAKETKIVIDWATDGASSTNYWEIQRSSDRVQFAAIALVLGPDPRQTGDKYQAADKLKDLKGLTTYYRLRHVGTDGKEQLSHIIQLGK
jgi:hypothetical protein